MKKIVSISIGSSKRNKRVKTMVFGEEYMLERIGTNGDIKAAIGLIKQIDGKVDAFGMGGIDLYLGAGFEKEYVIRDAVKIKEAAKITPITDGSGIKRTIEKAAVKYLVDNNIINFENKRVLVTSAIDRYMLTKAFHEKNAEVLIGDLIFALGLPYCIKNLNQFNKIAKMFMPIISQLPFKMLYPTGNSQNKKSNSISKFDKILDKTDIIAGDFHYIKKILTDKLRDKIVITNTVTEEDVKQLRGCGVKLLVTTTPEFDGRSFGTNMLEAIIVSILNKKPEQITEDEFFQVYEKLNYKPRIEYL